MFVKKGTESNAVQDMTVNNECSRCGSCCGLFIPFTDKELDEIKKYVRENNIQPTDRFDISGNMKAHCCFYNEKEKKCNIYSVRPYVCRDFMCNRKNWKEKRDQYEKLGKYNCTVGTEKIIMATFDDLIYQDYTFIIQYLFSLIPRTDKGVDDSMVVEMFKMVNRLDLLDYITATDENGNVIEGKELLERYGK